MDEATAYIVSKKVNFAALPVTFGANLYTKGVDVRLVGVYSWRLFYVVASPDFEFKGFQSFKEKRYTQRTVEVKQQMLFLGSYL